MFSSLSTSCSRLNLFLDWYGPRIFPDRTDFRFGFLSSSRIWRGQLHSVCFLLPVLGENSSVANLVVGSRRTICSLP